MTKPPRPETPRGVEPVLRRGGDGAWVWRFRVRYTDGVRDADGKLPRRSSPDFDAIPAAQAFKARRDAARARHDVIEVSAGDVTLAEFVEHEWWPNYAAVELERGTLPGYASVYNNHVAPHVGALRLRSLNAAQVARLRDMLLAAGVGRPTARRALVILQGICRFAVERGAMPLNPVRDISKPGVQRRLAITLPGPDGIERLLDELDPASRMLTELIAYVGLRPQEALALERRHRGRITLLLEQKWVAGSVVPGQKTGRGRARTHRSPTLPSPVAKRLDEHLAAGVARDRRAYMFTGRGGEPWTAYGYRSWRENVFKPAVARAELEITRPYDLRHACASIMLHAGTPLREIAEHMGHSVVTLSVYYAHVIADLRGHEPISIEQQILDARGRRA